MKRSMSRLIVAGCMALAALGAVVAPAQADPPENPFAGSWTGTWAASGEGDWGHVGTYALTISDEGRITGSFTNTTSGGSGTSVGHIGTDGKATLIDYAPNDEPATSLNGLPFKATAVIDEDGYFVAKFTCVAPGCPDDFYFLVILERI